MRKGTGGWRRDSFPGGQLSPGLGLPFRQTVAPRSLEARFSALEARGVTVSRGMTREVWRQQRVFSSQVTPFPKSAQMNSFHGTAEVTGRFHRMKRQVRGSDMCALLRHPPENRSFGAIWESRCRASENFRPGLRFSFAGRRDAAGAESLALLNGNELVNELVAHGSPVFRWTIPQQEGEALLRGQAKRNTGATVCAQRR